MPSLISIPVRALARRGAVLAALALPIGLAATAHAEEPAAAVEEAEAPEPTADLAAAKAAVEAYLKGIQMDAKTKTKKWDAARKVIHPRVLEVLADQKKRLNTENHALAAWARVNESRLVRFTAGEPRASVRGAVVVPVVEDLFAVQEQGDEPGVKAEYLVIPLAGRSYVADRRLGENQFPDKSVPAAYRGYFEGEYVAPAPPPKAGKKK